MIDREKLRRNIIHLLSDGRITLPAARRFAAKRQLNLEGNPDPADYDPMREPYWSAAMAVAWIAWRTSERVRDNWDDYFKQTMGFREYEVNVQGKLKTVYQLEQRTRRTLLWLQLCEACGDFDKIPMMLTIHDSCAELVRALRSGDIAATGKQANGPRIPIPDYEWNDLDLTGDELNDAWIGGGRAYTGLAIKRTDILKTWPPGTMTDLPTPSDTNSQRRKPGRPDKGYEEFVTIWEKAAPEIRGSTREAQVAYLAEFGLRISRKTLLRYTNKYCPLGGTE
jgi:hypothetical protein